MIRRMLKVLTAAAVLAVGFSAPASAQQKVSLRLDWVNSGYHAIWYYGVDKGLFKAEGIDLEVLEGRGSASTAQTVGNNSVMFGTSDSGSVMGQVALGLPIKIVSGYLRQNPMAIIYPKANGWAKFSDMAGARIGFSPGSASAQYLAAILKANGLDGKVQLVNLEGAAKPAALLEKRVNAIESFDFLQVPLFEANGLEVSTLPYALAGMTAPGLSLITHNDTLKQNPALVKKMVELMHKTIDAARKDQSGAIDSLLKRSPTLNRAVVSRVLALSFNLLDPEWARGKQAGWLSPEVIEKTQDAFMGFGVIKTKQPIGTYFTNEFVGG